MIPLIPWQLICSHGNRPKDPKGGELHIETHVLLRLWFFFFFLINFLWEVRVLDEMTTEGWSMHIHLFSNWQVSFLVSEDWENGNITNELHFTDLISTKISYSGNNIFFEVSESLVLEAFSLLWNFVHLLSF